MFHKSDLLLIMLLLAIWVIAAIIFTRIDKVSWIEELIELKIHFFCSIIIVGFISGFSRASKYRKVNEDQFWIYTNIMGSLERLYSHYYNEMEEYYKPLFNDETAKQTLQFVKAKDIKLPAKKLAFQAELSLRELEVMTGHMNFNQCNRRQLELSVNSCRALLLGISEDKSKYYKSYLEDLLPESRVLLEELGKPWQIDNDIQCKINELVLRNGHSLMSNFYRRMFVYSFNEIKEYERQKGSFEEMTEEKAREALALMGCELNGSFQQLVEERNERLEARKDRLC